MHIKLATYNVHRFTGRDNKKDIKRTGRVLQEIEPDIAALQEVEYFADPAELNVLLPGEDYHVALGPTIISGDEHYGNVLLSRFPVSGQRSIDLSWPGREKRGAIDADIDCHGERIRVIATHFGLAPVERRQQAKILLEEIDRHGNDADHTILLMGDMNEWFLWGRPLRLIYRHFGPSKDLATYPAGFPVFSLDRIWCHPPEKIRAIEVHKTALARIASDHLPLTCIMDLEKALSGH